MMSLFPKMTLLDEAELADGSSIDPLGLYATADLLAVRLAPGVRERQQRPRFLTIMAVSAAVCEALDEDRVAKDGVSPAWQVFEWYVVEGLVRLLGGQGGELAGLPGSQKVRSAVDEKDRVSARRYLKTPSVFGFHGVYRTLARELGVVHESGLDENGARLLQLWEKEQKVGASGWRKKFQDAVEDGLQEGRTCRAAGWEGFVLIRNHLAHDRPGPREGELLAELLQCECDGFRGDLFRFVISDRARDVWPPEDGRDESRAHARLAKSASPELRELLEAIRRYEQFSRLLTVAFEECLYEMSRAQRALTAADFAKLDSVAAGAPKTKEYLELAKEALEPLGYSDRLSRFENLRDYSSNAAEWSEALLAHHIKVQKEKPPQGKAPWVIRYDNGEYRLRPQYRVDAFHSRPGAFVHQYRTRPLYAFAQDLQLVVTQNG